MENSINNSDTFNVDEEEIEDSEDSDLFDL